jgi:CDP-glucose 4,6-dehydratase
MNLGFGDLLRGLGGPILVTGHTGFKGTWLTLLLETLGIPVIGLSLAPSQDSLFDRASRSGIISEQYSDIRNINSVKAFMVAHQPAAVIHMAAQPLVMQSYLSPLDTFETNVMGTANILSAAFEQPSVKAIVVVTTDKVYRNDNALKAFVESDPLEGKDPYSSSKVGAESVITAWQQIARIYGGPKLVSVRAGNVVGGGDWAQNRLMPDLVRGFIARESIPIRSPHSTRPWQHVLDPLIGYLMVLEAVLTGHKIDSINFGPEGDSLTVKDVVEISSRVWPNEVNVNFNFESNATSVEAINLQLNSTYAREIIGWSPYWSQRHAVESTIKWWDKVINKSLPPILAIKEDLDYLTNCLNSRNR